MKRSSPPQVYSRTLLYSPLTEPWAERTRRTCSSCRGTGSQLHLVTILSDCIPRSEVCIKQWYQLAHNTELVFTRYRGVGLSAFGALTAA
jgi:hypothetical protein